MSIIKDIHEQPAWIRTSLFALSCVTVISLAGYLWLTTAQNDVIIALDPQQGPEHVAELERSRPDPLNGVRQGLHSAAASIGSFIGFDSNEGFDIGPRNDDNQDRVYLLPLSE